MFNKLKTSTLIVVTAAATVFGYGQALAFSLPFSSPTVSQGVPLPGCAESPDYLVLERAARYVSLSVEKGFSRRHGIIFLQTTGGPIQPMDFPFEFSRPITNFCPNLEFISGDPGRTISESEIESAGVISSRMIVFDSEEKQCYEYEIGFEGPPNGIAEHFARREPYTGDADPRCAANQKPTANAGPDQTIASATSVTLDGTGSSDPDTGQTLTYTWSQTDGPTVDLIDGNTANPTFIAPDEDTTLTFQLIVTDDFDPPASSEPSFVTINVVSGVSVALSGGPNAITGTDPFTVTATFSKDVTGFEETDVVVTNGAVVLGSMAGGPDVYTFDVAPTGNSDVSIFIPASVAQEDRSDDFVNPNSASNTLRIGNRIVEITERAISSFMLGRANQLASNQPRLIRFLRGEGCGSFNASGNDAGGSLEGCTTQGNVWTEITAAWGNGSSYALGTIGAHQFVNENFLLGGMVQFDRAVDDRNNARGSGWMVGPYFAAKMAEQPLYFEGRLLYGQTSNKITPIGTYTDSFKTERWLAQLRAEGEIQQETITWIPLLDFTHTRDRSKAYEDTLGNAIGSQSVALTQLTSGMDFSMPLQSDAGSLEFIGGASAIYSSTRGGSADFENGRGRVHMGLNWDSGQGTTVRAGTFYDGIGSGYRSIGGNLGVDIRF